MYNDKPKEISLSSNILQNKKLMKRITVVRKTSS